jgi:hypothetical protein
MTDIEKAMLADPAVRAEFDALAPEYARARAVIERRAIISTTLKRIKRHGPCEFSWKMLLTGLGKNRADDEPLPYYKIVEICGLPDALWATRAEPQHAKQWRLYAVACARRVVHLIPDPQVAAGDVAWVVIAAELPDVSDAALYAARAAAHAIAYQGKAAEAAEREWQRQAFLELVGVPSDKKEEET